MRGLYIFIVVLVATFFGLRFYFHRQSALTPRPSVISVNRWKSYRSKEEHYSVLFPGIPQYTNLTKTFQKVEVQTKEVYVNADIQNSYFVSTMDWSVLGKLSPQEIFDKGEANTAEACKGQTLFRQAMEIQGRPGCEYEYVAGGKANYSVRIRYVLDGARMYMLGVVFLTVNPHAEDRHIFFDSFHFLQPDHEARRRSQA